jgi:hypothetical protein
VGNDIDSPALLQDQFTQKLTENRKEASHRSVPRLGRLASVALDYLSADFADFADLKSIL